MDAFRLPSELADRFVVRRVLGSGSMGAVLEVEDRRLGRAVALKRMLLEAGPVSSARFLREARALARLEHPGIVRIHDVCEAGEEVFLVTEILEGAPMDRIPKGTDPLRPMLDVAEALQAVHDAGLLHRDVKPANLFLTREGRGVILDFGLAFVDDRTRLTDSGMVVGTPAYLAPEILQGREASPASDWYSWGVSLFWLYEGRVPLGAAELHALLEGVVPDAGPVPYQVLTEDHPVRPLVEAALATDPKRRPRGREALEALLPDRRGRRPRRSSSRHSKRRGTRPRPAPPTSPRHGRGRILGGVVGVALVAIGVGTTLGRRAPPAPLPKSPAPPAFPPEVSRVLDAVDRELDLGLGLGPHPDPIAWAAFAETRPGIQVAYHYLSRDPDPWALPEAARREFRDLDGRLVSQGGPELFAPWLDLLELPNEFVVPEDLSHGSEDVRGRKLVGPAARLLAAFVRGEERADELQRELAHRTVPQELIPVGLMGEGGLRHLLENVAGRPGRDRVAELWTYPASRRMRTTLLAGARLLATDPADPEVASWPARYVGSHRAFLHTAVAAFPVEVLLPGPPRTEGAWALRAKVLRAQVTVRRNADLPWKGLVAARLHALDEASALLPENASDKVLAYYAAKRVEALLLLDREAQARSLAARHLDPVLRDRSLSGFRDIVTLLTDSWMRAHRDPTTRRVVAAVIARFERIPPRLDKRWYKSLRGAVHQLRKAFPAPPASAG